MFLKTVNVALLYSQQILKFRSTRRSNTMLKLPVISTDYSSFKAFNIMHVNVHSKDIP